MPFHSRFSPDKGCSVYVWHIQESVEELEALLPQVDVAVSKSQQRRKERLAVRLLLLQAGITGLAYEESGKPYIVEVFVDDYQNCDMGNDIAHINRF